MLNYILRGIVSFVEWFLTSRPKKMDVVQPAQPQEPQQTPTPSENVIDVPQMAVVAPLLWDTPGNARHSVRVICDEEGLTFDQKNLICQVIRCESGFIVSNKHVNSDSRKTTDHGICMFNDYWYKNMITPEEAQNNPEKAVRLMIKQFKSGNLKDWVCYSSGMYKNYPA